MLAASAELKFIDEKKEEEKGRLKPMYEQYEEVCFTTHSMIFIKYVLSSPLDPARVRKGSSYREFQELPIEDKK